MRLFVVRTERILNVWKSHAVPKSEYLKNIKNNNKKGKFIGKSSGGEAISDKKSLWKKYSGESYRKEWAIACCTV